jgi:hypothetical protein
MPPLNRLIQFDRQSEKPKVPDCVPIALKNVLDPEINKLFQGASDLNAFAGILILSRELNRLRLEVKVGNTYFMQALPVSPLPGCSDGPFQR